jgi:hypothetical protein
MTKRLEANGEDWDVQLSRERPHDGVGAVIFRCASNSSYGWRVVEVPAGEYETQERLDALSKVELRGLFDRSQPFDYTHDPKAHPDAIGDTPAP